VEKKMQLNKLFHKKIFPIDIESIFILFLSVGLIEEIARLLAVSTNNSHDLIDYISQVLYAIIFIYILMKITKNFFIQYKMVIIILTVVLLLFISAMIEPNILRLFKDSIRTIFLVCIPGFYLGRYVTRYDKILNKSKILVFLSFVYSILFMLYANISSDYLSASYLMLIPTLLSLIHFLSKKNFIYFIVTIFNIIVILTLGARGAILAVTIFLIFLMVLNPLSRGKKLLSISIPLSVFLFFLFFWAISSDFLFNYFPNSRTLSLLSSGSFFESSVRLTMYKYSISYSISNPIKFSGLFADRIILFEAFGRSNLLGFYLSDEAIGGMYAHNIFIEIILQFGVIFGFFVIYFLLKPILKALKKTLLNNEYKQYFRLYLVFLVSGLVYLMFSGSYLITPNFWLLLGFSLSIKRKGIKVKNNF
jgi:O-antigen ligase